MNGLLLDTHVWYWYLVGSDRLPAGLKEAIDDAPEGCRLSPISVWELGMLGQKGRVRMSGGVGAWLARALEAFPVREAPLTGAVARRSLEIELEHRDPADRFLAATALVYGLELLTVDRRLAAAGWLPTRSR